MSTPSVPALVPVPLADADLAGLPTLVRGQTFEEMVVGSRFRTASRTITETDLVTFVTLTGMNEPLFFDEAGSLDAGYAGRLVPGALVFSYAEGLVMQTGVIHGTGLAFLRADVSVQAPAFVGDTIAVVVEVVASRAASTGARGVVTTRNTVVKRGGGTVLVYEPVRLIRGRAAGSGPADAVGPADAPAPGRE
jgi:acyl dehydratase